MSTEHEAAAAAHTADRPIPCAVVTISDSRKPADDTSGERICDLVIEANGTVVARDLIPDDAARIHAVLDGFLADPAIRVILTTGGTGVSRRDTTIEVVRDLLTAELDGFGELFRMLSWAEVGAASMMSRAVGGLVTRDPDAGGDTFIFAMPGSTNACETAMTKLIVPQMPHLVWERER